MLKSIARVATALSLFAGTLIGIGGAASVSAVLSTTTIVVNTTDDLDDAAAGDGVCATLAGTCSLRAAIKTANQVRGANRIEFAIPGGGVHQITAATQLPDVTDSTGPLVIDGYSQPGSAVNTADGGSNAIINVQIASPASGTLLRIASKENVVRGLAVFGGRIHFLIEGEGADGNRIVGNFIGTDAAGIYENTSIGIGGADTGVGVLVQLGADRNAIGAPTLEDRNIISGNGGYGIRLNHGDTTDNLIQNTVVGLNPQLTAKLRQWHGIDMQWWVSGTLIGGNGPLEGNLVGGQVYRGGIEFSHGARKNFAIGNLIGTMPDGNTITSFSGNTYGISFKDGPEENYIADNVIGGNGVGIWHKHNYTGVNTFVNNRLGVGTDGGVIANTDANVTLTGTDQVWVDNVFANQSEQLRVNNYKSGNHFFFYETYTHANSIRQSQFHNSGAVAIDPYIDITPLGDNANDVGDADAGVQDLLNTPVVDGIGPGKIFGTACALCTVEVYVSGTLTADGTLDTSGTDVGTGLAWIGTVVADAVGVFSLADPRIVAGRTVSALAIDPIGNTSELPVGQVIPAAHVGVDGIAGASNGGIDAPPVPELPEVYVYPDVFACSYADGVLSWTGALAANYNVTSELNGSAAYVGSTTTTSLAVPDADEYLVRYRIAGTPFETTCAGQGETVFACSYDAGTLSWSGVGNVTYYLMGIVNGSGSYLGSTTDLSATVPAADEYRVRYRIAGIATDTFCPGAAPVPFECSVDAGTLSWTDVGASQYFLHTVNNGSTSYLAKATGTSTTVPQTEGFRVRYWTSGTPTDAFCDTPVFNRALAGTASQSSTDYSGLASRAIDDNTDGVYNHGSITHTVVNSFQAWWQVDLGTETSITDIVLWNRTDCCITRLSNFDVFVSSEPFGQATYAELVADPAVWSTHIDNLTGASLDLAVDTAGRYVRVQLAGANPLSLAEVQILGY